MLHNSLQYCIPNQDQNFKPIDVFNLEYVSNPKISPDGEKILYVRNFKDIMTDENYSNIWIVDYDGSNNTAITTGNQKDYDPRWSKSGDKFVFKSDIDSTVQLYLYRLSQNSKQKLTNSQNSIEQVSWSDDDKYLVLHLC